MKTFIVALHVQVKVQAWTEREAEMIALREGDRLRRQDAAWVSTARVVREERTG